MPKGSSPPDPRVIAASTAVRAYIEEEDISVSELARRANVGQTQISKLLNGRRKRWSADIQKLCQYAHIELDSGPAPWWEHTRLANAVKQALGDDARATDVLAGVIEAMVPALTALRSTPARRRTRRAP